MPGNPADDDEDDEGFGDFKFVSSTNSNHYSKPDDDEWGDFIVNNLQFHPSNGFLHPQNPPIPPENPLSFISYYGFDKPIESWSDRVESVEKKWEKPRGALPLSIFGDDDVEDSVDPSFDDALELFSSKPKVVVETGSSIGVGFNDLIVNLYGQAEQIRSDNGLCSDLVDGNSDFDENWQFKDAVSELEDHGSGAKKEQKFSVVSGSDAERAAINGEIRGVENGWGNHQGALPLSIFSNSKQDSGGTFDAQDVFRYKPTIPVENGISGFNFGMGIAVNDLISDFQSHTEPITVVDIIRKPTENGFLSDQVGLKSDSGNDDGDFDEDCWDFKDAFSETRAQDQSAGNRLANHPGALLPFIFSNDSGGTFDDQDVFHYKPTIPVENGISSFDFGMGIAVNDLISDLHSQPEPITVADIIQKPTENGFLSDQVGLKSDSVNAAGDFDEDCWDFKDAFSETRTQDQSSEFSDVNINWKFPTESKHENFLNFYSRLKEESCFLTLRHLDDLKKAKKEAALYSEEAEVTALHEKFLATYEKLQSKYMVSKNIYTEEHPLRNTCITELLEVMRELDFHAFDSEYHISKRIPLAEKDLSSAIGLFEHATSTLQILTLISAGEQSMYISSWSKMVSACSQELKHGAKIWMELSVKNVRNQILSHSQGPRYFLALGEIYRVAEILRASTTLYKPWILRNSDLIDIFTHLEECAAVWADSGLKEALESIASNPVGLQYKGDIKRLLESIISIRDLKAPALQSHVFDQRQPICGLSLLPLGMLRDMKRIVWDGVHYFLTLANLWANRISCDPPRLPHINVG